MGRSLYAMRALICMLLLSLHSCNDTEQLKPYEGDTTEFQTFEERVMATPELRNDTALRARMAANKILARFVVEAGDSVHLNITQEEAAKLGVPKMWYDSGVRDVEQANRFLQKAREEERELMQWQKNNEGKPVGDIVPYRKARREYTDPRGRMSSLGQEEVLETEWAPHGTKGIQFNCRSTVAPTAIFTCKTYSFGNWQIRTCIASPIRPTSVDVPLYASLTTIRVAFRTSDSNGGSVVYRGYK